MYARVFSISELTRVRLPQSPRWLVDNNRYSEALATLEKLHYRSDDPSNTFAKEEFYQIRMQIELERESGMSRSWTTLFTTPSYRKRLMLGFGTQLIAQSTGCLVVNNYQVILYKSLDITGSLPLLLNGVYNTQAACMNLVNSLLLDRIGRIKVMLIAVVRLPSLLALNQKLTRQRLGWLRIYVNLLRRDGR